MKKQQSFFLCVDTNGSYYKLQDVKKSSYILFCAKKKKKVERCNEYLYTVFIDRVLCFSFWQIIVIKKEKENISFFSLDI